MARVQWLHPCYANMWESTLSDHLIYYTDPNMLRSANLEVSLLTPRDPNADKVRATAPLEKIGWALFGIMNTSH